MLNTKFSFTIIKQYNRLRHEVGQTGRGRVPTKYKLKEIEEKALDYLREEAVKGE